MSRSALLSPLSGPQPAMGLWAMFARADGVVQAVMVALALASVLTLTVLVAKQREWHRLAGRLRAAGAMLGTASSLDAVGPAAAPPVVAQLLAQAHAELAQSADLLAAARTGGGVGGGVGGGDAGALVAGTRERLASRLEALELAQIRQWRAGIGVLATTGAIAPFVGLFGTVWGIMHSFIGLAGAQTTSLAVVAPGIAEALLATALGLVAAVPAVISYNICMRRLQALRGELGDVCAALERLVSRDLDRASLLLPRARAA